MALDRQAYDRSVIDWSRLTTYARKVARTTALPPTPRLAVSRHVKSTSTKDVKEGGFLGIGSKTRQVVNTTWTLTDEEVFGPHWLLDERTSEEDVNYESMFSSERQRYVYVLLADGSLRTALHVKRTRQHGVLEVDDDSVYVQDFQESDVSNFDFEKIRTHWEPRPPGAKWPGDAHNDSTGRLQRHAKGVGLSIRLKELLEGSLPPRSISHKHR